MHCRIHVHTTQRGYTTAALPRSIDLLILLPPIKNANQIASRHRQRATTIDISAREKNDNQRQCLSTAYNTIDSQRAPPCRWLSLTCRCIVTYSYISRSLCCIRSTLLTAFQCLSRRCYSQFLKVDHYSSPCNINTNPLTVDLDQRRRN